LGRGGVRVKADRKCSGVKKFCSTSSPRGGARDAHRIGEKGDPLKILDQ